MNFGQFDSSSKVMEGSMVSLQCFELAYVAKWWKWLMLGDRQRWWVTSWIGCWWTKQWRTVKTQEEIENSEVDHEQAWYLTCVAWWCLQSFEILHSRHFGVFFWSWWSYWLRVLMHLMVLLFHMIWLAKTLGLLCRAEPAKVCWHLLLLSSLLSCSCCDDDKDMLFC